MDRNEAFRILQLDRTASDEEIKKAFKKLAAKHHPDRDKSTDAEEKFKQINEAFQTLNMSARQPVWSNPNDWIWNSAARIEKPPITFVLDLTFNESVLGCAKDVTIERQTKCSQCNGVGRINVCKECSGRGQKIIVVAGVIVAKPCDACNGTQKGDVCTRCHGDGSTNEKSSFKISIPGGITNQTIRLVGMGHYRQGYGYTDAFVIPKVAQHKEMSFDGLNVISTIEVTLLEALEGCEKSVETVMGIISISIPAATKHNDTVVIHGYGAVHPDKTGDHHVKISILYPNDLSGLIKFLKE